MAKFGWKIVGRSERRARGKALREACPRASLGEYRKPPRSRDLVALVERSDVDLHFRQLRDMKVSVDLEEMSVARLENYAAAYADQVERDFAVFTKAVRAGRLKSDTGADHTGGL